MKTFKREIVMRPAYDKRDPDPSKNYGIHGVDMAFYLTGEKGTIQFVVYTNWQLRHVQEEMDRKHDMSEDGRWLHSFCHPQPADIGYHSPVPKYEGQDPITSKCSFIQGDCYYDGSSLSAEPIYWKLVEGGSDAVWKELEGWYERELA